MKVCFFSAIHNRFDARVFQKEARTLHAEGIGEIVHICHGEDEPFTEGGIRIVPYGFTYVRTNPKSKWAKIGKLLRRFTALKKLYDTGVKEQAHVYHCNELESWVVGLLVARKTGAVCIFDSHEDYSSTFTKNYLPAFMEKTVDGLMRKAMRWLCTKTDYIVIAKKTIDDQYPMPEGRKICVNNYAALSTLERMVPAKNNRTSGDPLWLVHSGGISRSRGWPQLLDALSMTKRTDIYLHVFGVFMDGSEDAFRTRMKELGLEHRVRIDGWVTHEKSYEFISAGHVGLMTLQPGIRNHIYAMPNKMFDYMVLGLPCIGPDFAVEVAEITKDSQGGVLLNPADPRAMAEAFDYFADNEQERIDMGQRGREAVLTHYNWESDSKKMVDMYKRIIREKFSLAFHTDEQNDDAEERQPI